MAKARSRTVRALVALLLAAALTGGLRFAWRASRAADSARQRARLLEALLVDDPAPLGLFPDGRSALLLSGRGGRFRLLHRELAGGATRVLDDSADPQHGAALRPDGRTLAFKIDRLAADGFDLYALEVATGARSRLLGVDGASAGALHWSPDGTRLAFVFRAGGGPRTLVVLDVARHVARALLEGVSRYAGLAWSADGARIATATEAEPGSVAVVPLDGGAASSLPLVPGGVVESLAWSPDGASIAAAARARGAEYSALHLADVTGGRRRLIAAPAADVGSPRFLPSGDALVYRRALDGEATLRRVRLDGGEDAPFGPSGGSVSLTRFSTDGTRAFATYAGRTQPKTALAIDLRDGRATVLVPGPPASAVTGVAAEALALPAPDGLLIPTYAWRAPRLAGREPAAAIFLHGGPHGQRGPLWFGQIDLLLREGIDVIAPNYRGSAGHGAAFEARFGERGEVDDVLAAVAYARGALGVPPGRVALVGFSYGSQLALEAAARAPGDVGAVMLVGVTDSRPRPASPPPRMPAQIVAYHGAFDPLSAAAARAAVDARLSLAARSALRFELLDAEPHSFVHPESWVRVYQDLTSFWAATR